LHTSWNALRANLRNLHDNPLAAVAAVDLELVVFHCGPLPSNTAAVMNLRLFRD